MNRSYDLEEKQVKEVYTLFGLAVYQVQCFERELAISLTASFGPGIKKITRKQYEILLNSYFNKTLGQLNKVLSMFPVDQTVKEGVKECLRIRNYLIHNYFWNNAIAFCKQEGREKMIDELKCYIAILERMDNTLVKLNREWGEKYGVNELAIEKQINVLLQEDC